MTNGNTIIFINLELVWTSGGECLETVVKKEERKVEMEESCGCGADSEGSCGCC